MALKSWYKLQNNFEDCSGNEYNATINSSTHVSVATSGKTTDGCYLLTSGGYITIPTISTNSNSYLHNVTITFWRKNYNNYNWLAFTGGDTSHYLMSSENGTGSFYNSNAGNPIIYVDGIIRATPYQDGKWHHYAIVGADLTSWTTFKVNGYNSSWDNFGYINDLRIYDESLSKKEIYEISRGKILHYSMDNLIEPTSNLIDYSNWYKIQYGTSNWNVSYGGAQISYEQVEMSPDYNYKISKTIGYNIVILDDIAGSFARRTFSIPNTSGVKYIFSCYYLSSSRFGIIKCDDGNGGNVVSTTSLSTGNWERLIVTYTTNSSGMIRVQMEFSDGVSDDGCIFIAPMLEKKNNVSDFVWGSRSLYLIRDSSGFNNNTYISISNPGIPYLSTTSKINDHSYYFTSTNNNTNNGSAIPGQIFLPSEEFSISFWAYRTTSGYQNGSYFSIGSIGYMGIDTYDNSCSLININGTTMATIPFSTTLNQWCFATIVVSTTKLSSYINGVLYSEISYTKSNAYTNNTALPVRIGYSIAGGAYRYYNGYMNDFRIYATALDSSYIQYMYNKKHSIDNKGNVYSTKFLESNNSNSSLLNSSICKSSELNEVGPNELLNGLVGWWKLNQLDRNYQHTSEYSNCDIRDFSGFGSHAKNVGSMKVPLNNYDAIVRYAGDFNGNTTIIQIPDNSILNVSLAITVSAWIRPVTQKVETIICKNGNSGFSLGINVTKLKFTSGNIVTEGGAINYNQWNHVAATSKNGETKLYINGSLVVSNTNTYSPSLIYGVGYIGALNTSTEKFDGSINDVRVYNRVLNQNEIYLLLAKGYNEEFKIMNNKIFPKGDFNEINI